MNIQIQRKINLQNNSVDAYNVQGFMHLINSSWSINQYGQENDFTLTFWQVIYMSQTTKYSKVSKDDIL